MLYGKILLVTLILLSYFGCNSFKDSNLSETKLLENTTEIPNDLLITLERTSCLGTCPVYKLSVKADGSVLFEDVVFIKIKGREKGKFEGFTYTKPKGKIETKISTEKLRRLIKEFENADYLNFKDKYDYKTCSGITDSSSALTSIQINGRKQSINHYEGCEANDDDDSKNTLPKLRNLENKIDEIVETKRWIGEGK